MSLEPTFKRREDLGKHSVSTHFPKDRNCEICPRTRITTAPCRRRNGGGGAVPRAENFGDLITADHKVLSEGCESRNNHPYLLWCRTWPPNGSSRIRAKQKLLRKHKGACKSSWSRVGIPKSFTLKIPWNLAKPIKIFPGIIVRQHHTDQKQMGLLKEQCAEKKKAPLPYCCNQVWMKVRGQIPWNAVPMGDVLGNHLMDRSFRLVPWLSITLFCERPVKNPSIWKERLTWIVPWLRFVRGWNLEG